MIINEFKSINYIIYIGILITGLVLLNCISCIKEGDIPGNEFKLTFNVNNIDWNPYYDSYKTYFDDPYIWITIFTDHSPTFIYKISSKTGEIIENKIIYTNIFDFVFHNNYIYGVGEHTIFKIDKKSGEIIDDYSFNDKNFIGIENYDENNIIIGYNTDGLIKFIKFNTDNENIEDLDLSITINYKCSDISVYNDCIFLISDTASDYPILKKKNFNNYENWIRIFYQGDADKEIYSLCIGSEKLWVFQSTFGFTDINCFSCKLDEINWR